jgi:hypothetical protein
MKIWLRGIGTALAAGAIAVTACGGSTAGSGGGASSSCDRYFDAIFASCQGPVPPASEQARRRARFDQACASALDLPGISVTAAKLDACTSAVQSLGCNAIFQGTCQFGPGSLADGAHCSSPEQCMSDACTAGQQSPNLTVMTCGTCVAGGMCGSAVCTANTICVTNSAGGASCEPIAFGGAGAACDGQQAQCNPGLVCNQKSHICAAPGAMGSPCAAAFDCGGSLMCPVGTQGMAATCQNPGPVGSPCQSDGDCSSDLGCDDTTHQCATVTWASAGQACGPTTRCLGGSCPPNGPASPTCPTVIANGQACNANDPTQTCDYLATCAGTCQILGATNCP